VITKMIARYLTINQNMLKIVTTWKTDQTQWPPISEKQCCDTLQMVTTWKTDKTQYPPISEKQCCDTLQMMVTTTKKQPGRQIKRCFIQSKLFNLCLILLSFWTIKYV
jgi:hypothetical protein